MTAHAHAWTPVDGAAGQYRCECGTWGRRPRHGGAIVERRTPYYDGAARPTVGNQPRELAIGGKAPSLDEQERRR